MEMKELAWSQILLGCLAIIGYALSTVSFSPVRVEGTFTLMNSLGLLFGLFAILTGSYNLKSSKK